MEIYCVKEIKKVDLFWLSGILGPRDLPLNTSEEHRFRTKPSSLMYKLEHRRLL